jgi:hypothetical protein
MMAWFTAGQGFMLRIIITCEGFVMNETLGHVVGEAPDLYLLGEGGL